MVNLGEGMNRKRVILFVILFVAAFLRLYKLGEVPTSMYIDEVAIGVDAKSIAQTGKDMHGNSVFSTMFPSYGDYKLPVYVWLAAASVKVFGASAFAIRLPSAVAGIWTVALIYLLSVELFEKHKKRELIGLFSAGVAAILPWSLLFSRTGFEAHVGQAFLLCSILFMLWSRKTPKWFFAASLLGAVAVYTYFSVRFVFPAIFFAVFLLWCPKQNVRNFILWFLFSSIFFVALILPLLKSRYYVPSEAYRLSTKNILTDTAPILYANELRDADNNSFFSRIVHHRSLYRLKNLTRNYVMYLDLQYLFLHGDSNLRHSTGEVGIVLLSFAPPFFAGLYVLVKRWPKIILFFGIWYVIALLPASVPTAVPHALRSINGLGVISLVCGVGGYELWHWFNQRKRQIQYRGLFVLFLLLVAVNFFSFQHDYYVHYPSRSHKDWDSKWKALATFVTPYVNNASEVRIVNDFDKVFLWVLFYGDTDFEKVQVAKWNGYILAKLDNVQFLHETEMKLNEATLFVGIEDAFTTQSLVQTNTFEFGDNVRYILVKK